jgi:hypothetical protein
MSFAPKSREIRIFRGRGKNSGRQRGAGVPAPCRSGRAALGRGWAPGAGPRLGPVGRWPSQSVSTGLRGGRQKARISRRLPEDCTPGGAKGPGFREDCPKIAKIAPRRQLARGAIFGPAAPAARVGGPRGGRSPGGHDPAGLAWPSSAGPPGTVATPFSGDRAGPGGKAGRLDGPPKSPDHHRPAPSVAPPPSGFRSPAFASVSGSTIFLAHLLGSVMILRTSLDWRKPARLRDPCSPSTSTTLQCGHGNDAVENPPAAACQGRRGYTSMRPRQ